MRALSGASRQPQNVATADPDHFERMPSGYCMSVLFGHPGGNPNSHNAALSYVETGRLEAMCVPWMPSLRTLRLLEFLGPLRPSAQRLRRRHFPALWDAPKIECPFQEIWRLSKRALGSASESLSYEANDWLMTTMARECKRPSVTAVHCYEDCALLQFVEAKRLGKGCIYDMPIGYYPAWEQTQNALAKKFAEWLPPDGLPSNRHVRPEQKRQEMELADLVLVPSTFVANTIRAHHPSKRMALAPYGVDSEFWNIRPVHKRVESLRFLYAGQISLRKGIPDLLDAWSKANPRSAELRLIGSWHLNPNKKYELPRGVKWFPASSPSGLREQYHQADVFVFPSFFEGFGLVLLEAMACGLPVIASSATIGADVVTTECGRILPVGDVDALVEAIQWFSGNRGSIAAMGAEARRIAEQSTWDRYRSAIQQATTAFA